MFRGVDAVCGNYYVTNSRFVGSLLSDASITAHASSLRRVVSVGSRQFLSTAPGSGGGSPTKVHGCLVTGWGAGGGSSSSGGGGGGGSSSRDIGSDISSDTSDSSLPAIVMTTRGPLQIVDTVFARPSNASSSAVALGGGGGGEFEAVLLSNTTTLGPCGPLLDPATAGNVSHLYTYPPGDPAVSARLPPLSASTSFFRSGVLPVPPAALTFDAVVQFGADNTGRDYSSVALQACIDAAAAAAAAATAAGSGGGGGGGGGGGVDALCYLPSGVYTLNATLHLCGANFTLGGGGSGYGTILAWGAKAVPLNGSSSAVTLVAGPAAGCSSNTRAWTDTTRSSSSTTAATTNVTLQRLNAFTSAPAVIAAGQADLVVSRTATVPASPTGRHPALVLPVGGGGGGRVGADQGDGNDGDDDDDAAAVSLVLESVYFSSRGGAVLNALRGGDTVRGELFDGNLEVLDSADAIVLGGFYAVGTDGLTVARLTAKAAAAAAAATAATPPAAAPAAAAAATTTTAGFLGFAVMVSASDEWDVRVLNSSSLAAADFYSETSHGNVLLSGTPSDARGTSTGGLVAISAAKLNTNAPLWPALNSSDYFGTFWHSGSVASYSLFNATVSGDNNPVDVVLVGESFWVNSTPIVNTTGAAAATVHMEGNLCVNGPPSFVPDVSDKRTAGLVAAGLDAIRMVGILDVELNYPWVLLGR